MTANELNKINEGGETTFFQRVWGIWKDGTKIGADHDKHYDYWLNRGYQKNEDGSDYTDYWYPKAPVARFHLRRVLDDQNRNPFQKLGVILIGLAIEGVDKIHPISINAKPDKGWSIPVTAPDVPEGKAIDAKARRVIGDNTNIIEGHFDEGKELEEWQLAQNPDVTDDNDIYRKAQQEQNLTVQGNAASEAQLRYEHHARIRMQARRKGGEYAENAQHLKQDELDKLPTEFREWSDNERIRFMTESREGNATDHSTIMTNPRHAENIMAYDVAIGYCRFGTKSWMELRQLADWRWIAPKHPELGMYFEYFDKGTINGGTKLIDYPDYKSNIPKTLGMIDDRTYPDKKDDEERGR